jgi:hypothetical protein
VPVSMMCALKVSLSITAAQSRGSVWVKVLAVVAWVAWLVLVAMLTVEVVAVARNRPSASTTPAWVRRAAQVLVAAAVALAGLGQQSVAVATSGSPVLFAASASAYEPEPVGSAETDAPIAGRLVTVEEGDSWGGFAAEVLGDASLGPQLRTANLGRDVGTGQTVSATTAFVEPGWRLLIPTGLDVAQPSLPASPGGEPDTKVIPSREVAEGDHFWGIAEETLTDSWGRTPTDAELRPYWRQLVEGNTDRLLPPGDPDPTYPGQSITVPAPPADPTAGAEDVAASSDEQREEPDSSEAGWRAAIEDDEPSSPRALRTAAPVPAPTGGASRSSPSRPLPATSPRTTSPLLTVPRLQLAPRWATQRPTTLRRGMLTSRPGLHSVPRST